MLSTEASHTNRLIAERLSSEHLDELRRMHRDPRVMATLAPAGAPNGLLSDEESLTVSGWKSEEESVDSVSKRGEKDQDH